MSLDNMSELNGGRYEGFLGLAYDAAEAEGLEMAELIWPVVIASAITLPGLFYSYWMAPNPIGREPDHLQKAFSWLASPFLFIYNSVPGLTNIPYVSTAMRWLMPQYFLHEYVKPILSEWYAAKGKAFIRPLLEELSKFRRENFGSGSWGWRDFVPSQMKNPGQFAQVLSSIASAPLQLAKAVFFNAPREWGILERLFGIAPKTLDERNAEEAYENGKQFHPSEMSIVKLIKGLGDCGYWVAGKAVDTPIYFWNKLESLFSSFKATADELGGIDEYVKGNVNAFVENLDERAQGLEDSNLYFSKETWLAAQWGVVGAGTVLSIWGASKALSWMSHTVHDIAAPLMAKMPLVGQYVPPAYSAINQQLAALQVQVSQLGALDPFQLSHLIGQIQQQQALTHLNAQQQGLLHQMQGQIFNHLAQQKPAVLNVYGGSATGGSAHAGPGAPPATAAVPVPAAGPGAPPAGPALPPPHPAAGVGGAAAAAAGGAP